MSRSKLTEGEQWMAIGCLGAWREEVCVLVDTYLPEFMWCRKFGGPVAFGHILKHISEHVMCL